MKTKHWVAFGLLKGQFECDNCGRLVDGMDLAPIEDFFKRVEPGGIVPGGTCPSCGALCYPVKEGDDDSDNVSSEGLHSKRGDT